MEGKGIAEEIRRREVTLSMDIFRRSLQSKRKISHQNDEKESSAHSPRLHFAEHVSVGMSGEVAWHSALRTVVRTMETPFADV